MKLSDWARRERAYATAWLWWKQGRLPVPAHLTPSGSILVDLPPEAAAGRSVVYARVWRRDQRADLERQVARVTAWATAGGLPVHGVVAEVAGRLTEEVAQFLRPGATGHQICRAEGVRRVGLAQGQDDASRQRRLQDAHPHPVGQEHEGRGALLGQGPPGRAGQALGHAPADGPSDIAPLRPPRADAGVRAGGAWMQARSAPRCQRSRRNRREGRVQGAFRHRVP